jgi:hypothetical protein
MIDKAEILLPISRPEDVPDRVTPLTGSNFRAIPRFSGFIKGLYFFFARDFNFC